MTCQGHSGAISGCFLPKKEGSFWGLCLSCERIQNRLFLEATQTAIKDNKTSFRFAEKIYSLDDPILPNQLLANIKFVSSSQDPRLTLLTICYAKAPNLFRSLLNALEKDISFVTSANLLYRKHLPSRSTCGLLNCLQYKLRQRFLDMPTCPCCMSRYLIGIKPETLSQRQTSHILSIFRNQVLAQHPTWFVSMFKLLQTIWEQNLEDKITFELLNTSLVHQNPVQFQIEFRDWMGAFLETPIVIEKILNGTISDSNREFLQLWTGQPVNMAFIKRIQRNRRRDWWEDLIIKTWHPDRLLTWCMDIEELKEFAQ